MNYQQNRIYIVICEGISEVAYIQELNRLFRELSVGVVLQGIPVGTGFCPSVIRCYKKEHRRNPRTPIYIWVDWDLYARNEHDCMKEYCRRSQGIPDFLFSHQNFEDFLVSHLSQEEVEVWKEVCNQRRHFQVPMRADEYLPLFQEHVFATYAKGELPLEVSLTTIKQMLHCQEDGDMPFHCDFAELVRQILQNNDVL